MSNTATAEPIKQITKVVLNRTVGQEDASVFLKIPGCKVFNSSVDIDALPPGIVLRRKANSYGFTGVPIRHGVYISILTVYTDSGHKFVRLVVNVKR